MDSNLMPAHSIQKPSVSHHHHHHPRANCSNASVQPQHKHCVHVLQRHQPQYLHYAPQTHRPPQEGEMLPTPQPHEFPEFMPFTYMPSGFHHLRPRGQHPNDPGFTAEELQRQADRQLADQNGILQPSWAPNCQMQQFNGYPTPQVIPDSHNYYDSIRANRHSQAPFCGSLTESLPHRAKLPDNKHQRRDKSPEPPLPVESSSFDPIENSVSSPWQITDSPQDGQDLLGVEIGDGEVRQFHKQRIQQPDSVWYEQQAWPNGLELLEAGVSTQDTPAQDTPAQDNVGLDEFPHDELWEKYMLDAVRLDQILRHH